MGEDERGSGVGLAVAIVAGVLVVLLVCGGGLFGLGLLRWRVASQQEQAVMQVEQARQEAEAARREAEAVRQAAEAETSAPANAPANQPTKEQQPWSEETVNQ